MPATTAKTRRGVFEDHFVGKLRQFAKTKSNRESWYFNELRDVLACCAHCFKNDNAAL